jgi:tRNA(Ile)-lysidine synthase
MILETVKKTIRWFNLFKRGDKILIACSGGADSVCLLHVLLELRKDWELELAVGHFNHKIRQESDEDEKFVEKIARKYSLPFYSLSKDVKLYAERRGINLEEAGRELRYNFLRKTIDKTGDARIATAHTMNDQAETVLMRLVRGSGSRGLAGIFPVVDGIIVRPLLRVERKEVEYYLSRKEIDYRVDKSNFDPVFLRNRIRMELLPYLLEKYEPGLVSSLGRTAEIISEEDAELEKIAYEKAQTLIRAEEADVSLDLVRLEKLSLALKRRVVRIFIRRLRRDIRDISFVDVEAVLQLGRGKEFHLEKDLVLKNEKGQLISREELLPVLKYEYLWMGNRILNIKEADLRFEARKFKKAVICKYDFDDKACVFLDWNKLAFPLTVRSRCPGDRYQPLGAPGRKKLKEAFREKGIPSQKRDRCPVFLSGDKIVWALGLPVSEHFIVTETTTDIFSITLKGKSTLQ